MSRKIVGATVGTTIKPEKILEKANVGTPSTAIINSAVGKTILTTDSANAPIVNLQAQGESEQNGTPTMDSPVEVENLENVEVKVLGKNWFDVDKFKNSDGWQLDRTGYRYQSLELPVGTYTFSCAKNNIHKENQTAIDNKFAVYIGTNAGTSTNNQILGNYSSVVGNAKTLYTFTVKENEEWYINLYTKQSFTSELLDLLFNEMLVDVMLNIGTVALPHEPCKEPQTITIPHVLRGISEYRDYVGYKNCEFVQSINRKFITRNDFLAFNTTSYENVNCVSFEVHKNYKLANTRLPALCNKFIYDNTSSYREGTFVVVCSNISSLRVYFYVDKSISTLDDFMNIVGGDLYVDYVLDKPIITDLTEAELEAYKQLHTNYPTTIILSNAELEVEYVADTKIYIDNKFKELQTNVTSAIAQLL